MRSIVIGALFDALPAPGFTVPALQLPRRRGQRRHRTTTAAASCSTCKRRSTRPPAALGDGEPLILAGWSFGADMTLATHDARVAAWIGIAPPLRFRTDFDAVADDA